MVAGTALFVPADRPERFAKAAASGAEAIIIDLEDAVAPAAKSAARDALRAPGALPDFPSVFIRVNAIGTPWHDADMAALTGLRIAGVMLPKAESSQDIARLRLPVIALIETASGLAAARAIAAAGAAQIAFGSVDYAADLGLAHEREPLLCARAELVLASRLAGLHPPLDGVTLSIDDEASIEDDARSARALGFGGKLCIHPRQLAPIRRGFAPSPAEIAWAQRILAASAAGAVAVDGAMVDPPVRRRAEQILRAAEASSRR
jgi:citrate lyase subunit beta/citryl-CoA lyase